MSRSSKENKDVRQQNDLEYEEDVETLDAGSEIPESDDERDARLAREEEERKKQEAIDEALRRLDEAEEELERQKQEELAEAEQQRQELAKQKAKRKRRVVFLAVVLAVIVAGAVLLGVFGRQIQWWQWQHIIGAVGGLVLLFATLFIFVFLPFDNLSSTVWLGFLLVSGPTAVVYTLLTYFFLPYLSIIFYWLTGYLLLFGVLAAFCAVIDDSGIVIPIMLIHALQIVASIVFVALLPRLNWTQIQHFFGAIIGFAVIGILIFCCGHATAQKKPENGEEKSKEELDKTRNFKPFIFSLSALTIANVATVFATKGAASVIACWAGGWCLAASLFLSIFSGRTKKWGSFVTFLLLTFVNMFAVVVGVYYGDANLYRFWDAWQFVVGAFGWLVVIGLSAFVALIIMGLKDTDTTWTMLLSTIPLLAVNVVLRFVLPADYYIISFWGSGYLAAYLGLITFGSFGEDDLGRRLACIAVGLLNIVYIVLSALIPWA